MITVDSPKRAPSALSTLEGAAQGVLGEACASLENEIPAGGPPYNVVGKAPSVETVVVLLLSARQFNLAIGGPRRPRSPNRLVLNSPVKSMK